ncbi:MAG: GyrI-like domain-containing protein [Candidatus Margulisiibacteriota bacterium]|jgi:effector-binding domain-containing protein
MSLFKKILIAIIILAIILLLFLGYMGVFSKVTISEKEMGPYTLVYQSFVGPYQKTGKVFSEVYEKLKTDGIITEKGLGIYYDNPQTVPSDKLKSDCGSVIEGKNIVLFEKVKDKYQVKNIDKKLCLVGEFPIKNSFSYMLGAMKVYPILMNYAKEKNYKIDLSYELYDMPNKVTYYVFVISK